MTASCCCRKSAGDYTVTSPANAKNCLSVGATQVGALGRCQDCTSPRQCACCLQGHMSCTFMLLQCCTLRQWKPEYATGFGTVCASCLHCRPAYVAKLHPPLQTANEAMETTAVKYVVWDATVTEGEYSSTFK